jgi:glycosyltransferase involved in cell wall biosynthesis
LQHIHKQGVFRGFRNISLFFSGFKAVGDVNIVVFRFAISAMLRNLFTGKYVLAVIHNYDPADYKSWLLRIYSWKFFLLLRLLHPPNFAVITVAPYWQEYFSKRFKRTKVFLIPNLFDNQYYNQFRVAVKKKKIHLGQYSPKNDPRIFNLAEKLTAVGYDCYFTSLNQTEEVETPSFNIKNSGFEDYLKEMSESEYTLALTSINEGWNRIAHESLLVGTPVIGYARGGLGNLLHGSCSTIVKSTNEAFDVIIRNQKSVKINSDFTDHFDVSKSDMYFKELISWFNYSENKEQSALPLVSVVIPDAIESILGQSYRNFELIIVNDGSTDHSGEIALSYDDQRIKYIRLEHNSGNAFARNTGLEKASGKYVMIQDSDDMSLPDRMKIQVEFMEAHPWIGVCGSFMKVIEENREYYRKYPCNTDLIRAILFSKNPVAQPAVMFRKDVFDTFSLRHLKYYEDFNLWYQASKVTAVANIPKVLVHYRLFSTEQKLHHRQVKEHVVELIFRKKLSELDINIPEQDFPDFARFIKGYLAIDKSRYIQYKELLNQIGKANRWYKIYPAKEFRACILYDRLRLWKFYFKTEKMNALTAMGGISRQIFRNFDCWRILLQNF